MSTDLKFHPLAGIFPLMKGAEFDELVADIKANGLGLPIILYKGMILDGRNRYRALHAFGVPPEFIRDHCCVTPDCIDEQGGPAAYVISANIRRRHLAPEDKIKILAQLVAAHPEKSDRKLAKEAGVSHPTMAKARREAEATGKALPVGKRVGADGKARKQPARKAGERTVRRDLGAANAAPDNGGDATGGKAAAPSKAEPPPTSSERSWRGELTTDHGGRLVNGARFKTKTEAALWVIRSAEDMLSPLWRPMLRKAGHEPRIIVMTRVLASGDVANCDMRLPKGHRGEANVYFRHGECHLLLDYHPEDETEPSCPAAAAPAADGIDVPESLRERMS